jgi:hypothetical protein
MSSACSKPNYGPCQSGDTDAESGTYSMLPVEKSGK